MTDPASPQDRLAGLSREQRALLFEQVRRRKEKARAAAPPAGIPRRPPGLEPLPLSFAQERLWFIDRMQPGLSAYNIPQALLITGEASPAVFAALLGEVVRRHEVLRTTFREVDGQPVQAIAPAGLWTLPFVDLSALPAELRGVRAKALAQEESDRPFDLARGPLLRAVLLRLAPAEHALLLSMHHIVSDGWSMGVLVREISALYGAARAGSPSPLPELPIQYADFAVWQRGWLRGEVLERQLAYWREKLAGVPATLDLPTDRPLPPERTHAGARLRVPLPAGFAADLAAFARRHEATPFMVLLAAFQALLSRLTGQEELTVGSPIANRNREEIEPLIGFFVNTLVLRGDLAGDPSFEDLLARVRKTTLEAYAHQDLPFERLVEALRPERHLAVNPLFRVLFAVQNAPLGAVELPGLSLAPLAFETTVSQFDFEVGFWDFGGEMLADIAYSTELFDAPTARRIAAHLETLLRRAMADAGGRVSALPLLSPEERQQLVREWNDTGSPAAGAPLAHEIAARQAERTPDAVAVEHGEEILSYRALVTAARRLAGVLRGAGVGPDVPVGLWAGRSLALPVSVLAILEAGGACLPLDPSYPAERLALMIGDARPRLVLAEEAALADLPPGLLDGVEVAVLDRRGGIVSGSARPAPPAAAAIRPGPENLAYILYTSGSTGRPKGVALPHRALANLAAWAGEVRPDRGRRVLQFSPLGFDVSFEELFSTWGSGGTLVMMPDELRRDPAALLSFLVEKRIERLFQPFVALQQLAEIAGEQGGPPPALRELITAGEQLRVTPAVAALFQGGARLFNEYGPTETHVTTAFLLPGPPDRWPALPPIGRPIANHRVHLLDRGRQPVAMGVPGELCVGGAGLARGYLGRPDLTADRFIPDPGGVEAGARLYRTGDLARWLASGDLEYLGRTDFQVKVRGYRVEPGEVEAVVAAQPNVRAAAVVARQDPPGGPRLVAYVVWDGEDGSEDGSEAGLREALRARLPAPMVPAAFVALAALPLTPSGKLDRRALTGPAFSPQGAPAAAGYVEPAAGTEREIAAIWSEILDVERVGARDDFFELGGHSLMAVQILSRMRARLGVDLPVRALFEAPVLAELARRAEQAGALPATTAAVRSGARTAPLSFAQERLWFLDRMEPGNPAFNMGSALRLRGRLNAVILERTLNEIVRRHEALRTSFVEIDGVPMQRIAPNLRVPLPVVDLSALPETVRELAAGRVTLASLTSPFELAAGPLVRASLLRLAADLHLFVLEVHHIVSDGWSAGVMDRELIALYDAFAAGRPSPLPPLAIQYADFARWQREWLRGETLEAQLSYWRAKLGGELAPLDLPADRPRPPVQTFRGGRLELRLPEALGNALRKLSREGRASLFMTLLAAFQALLSRLSGQDDIVVGSPVAGRHRAETEPLIGFFLNTLALRTDLAGNPSFRELLVRVRETTLGAFAHQDIPFEALLVELKPERDLSRTPVFQVFFNMLNFPPERGRLPSLEVEAGPAPEPESKFDLTVYAAESREEIRFNLVYNADLFDAPRMEELLRQYRVLLEAVAREPGRRVGDFSLVTPEAAAVLPDPTQLLGTEWHGAVHELFLAAARRHPERVAVVDPRGSWTYGELAGAAGRLAAHLRAAGVEPGDRVAIWAHRSAPIAWAVLGTLAAGGAFVMLDPAYPAARLVEILRLAEPRAWVALADAAPPPREVEELLAGWDAERRLLGRITLPGGGPAAARDLLATFPAPGEPAATGPDDLAFVAFTSGSTGTPKGILGRHGPLSHFLPWQRERFGLTEEDRYSLLSGLAHDPLQRDLFTALCTGASLHAPDPEEIFIPGRLAAWAARQGITVAHLTPAMGQVLTESPGDGTELTPVPSLRYVLLVGDVLTRLDVDRLRRLAPGVTCVNLYGSTETQRAVGYHVVDAEAGAAGQRARQVLPLGRGMEDVQILVVNAAERLAGIGEVGEIWMRSPHLARGYLGDEALTRERFLVNPFTGRSTGDERDRVYRTGDLGRYLPDGEAVFAGRADQQVKIRGFRIEPGEIQAAIGRLEGVRESVVVVREERGDRYLAAYVVPEPGAAPDLAGRLRPFLLTRLPDYMVPAAFVELPALPLTPNGKVDRRALPAPQRQAAGTAAPRGPVEERLAGLWADLLRLDAVGAHDNFFELGGHSLLATQLVSRVRGAFAVELPLRVIFEAPTVADLTAWIERTRRTSGEAAVAPPIARVPRDHPLPLSFAQERLWFLQLLAPASPVYNMGAALRLAGRLDTGALAAALSEILRRHEALRTTFRATATGAVQEIHPAAPLPQPVVDLASLPEEVRPVEAWRIATAEGARPFDLEHGPLLRALLLRLGDEDHVALWGTHHIAADGWSLSAVFVPELTRLYTAFVQGVPSPLPEPPVQYADYAVWQREWLRGEVLAEQLGYWRRQLAGLAPLELPTDRPRPPAPSGRGGSRSWELAAASVERLGRLARAGDATLFMGLFAAFAAVLHRETGQIGLPVGMPVASRSRAEIEGLIGFFVNTLVLHGDLAGDPDLPELLARSRETVLGALSHQDVPFERLVDELGLPRNPHRPPLLRVTFQLQTAPADGYLELPGLTLQPFETDVETAKFDLVVNLYETGASLAGVFLYDADLFDGSTVARLAGHFGTLLEAWIDEPGRRLADLPLLSAAERHQLLVEWNPGAAEDRVLTPLHLLFEAQVDGAPEAPALSVGTERLTYGELDRRANRLARHLQVSGVRPGDRVALLLERSAEMLVAILAVLKTGAAYVPLDPAYPAERLGFTLEDSGASLLVTSGDLTAAAVRTVRLDAERDEIEACSGERLEIPADPELPAYIIYTSGSTGRPKGVVISHASVHRLFTATEPWFGFGADDVWTLFHSYAFDFSVWEIWGALLHGGRLVVVPYWESRSPEAFYRLLRDERVTVLNQTPSAFRQLLWAEETVLDGDAPDLSLQYVVFGGEALEPASLAPWFSRHGDERPRLVNMYGITETTVHVTWRPVRMADLAGGSLIGKPIPDLAVHLLDPGLRPVAIGTPGEIHVGGAGLAQAGLAQGYLGRPDLTAERFVPDPFSRQPSARLYRSGDLARRLPNGDLEYLGRIDQQVKIRGFRIELGEIEAALSAQPGVREAVVLAREEGERRLVAYLVGDVDDPAVLRRSLAERLPDYMLPAAFVFLDALPLTENGKIDRRALPTPEAAGAVPGKERLAPRTPLESFAVDQFREVLGLPAGREIGIDEDFFDLGGHSLLATQLVSRVREAFKVELPLRTVFEASTAAGLAAWIERARQAANGPAAPPIRRIARDHPLPLSFAQERLWFLHLLAPESPVYNLGASMRLAGRLDAGVLAAALSEVLRRHEALRTTFRPTAAGAVQEIHPWAPLPHPLIDLAALPGEVREEEARRIAGEEGARPFDLERGPLLRALLLRLGVEDHVALWRTHHVTADGWSLSEVFVPELTRLYAAGLQRRPSPLPEPPVQYADYATWQRQWLRGEVLAEQLGYWRRQLAGLAPLELPADRPRPPVPSGRGGSRSWELPAGLTDSLSRLARAGDATLFMALFAAFAAVLHRETGAGEVPVGMPVASRSRSEIERLIGFFVNTLVLRGDLAGDPDLPALLARSRDTVLGALSHQDIPFERLVDELALPRNPHRPPLLRVTFQFQTASAAGGLNLPGLTPALFEAGVEVAKFDLVLDLFEARSVAGVLRYDSDLFDDSTVARLAGHFTTLLATWIDEPARRLSDLPLLTAAERHQLLVEWNPGVTATCGLSCLHRLFEAQVDRASETPAVSVGTERLTYGELDRRANQLARHLRTSGVRPGDRVALLLERSAAMVAAILAVLKTGAAYVPLDPAYPAERLAFTLEDSGASLLIVQGETAGGLGMEGIRTVRLDAERDEIERRSGERLEIPADPDLPAYVIYTSGSTGRPKGVVVSHASVDRLFTATAPWFGFGADDVWTLFHSYAFDFSVWELWGALLHGGRLVMVPYWGSRSPEDFYRLIRDERVTVLNQTPSAFRQLLWAEETVLHGDPSGLALRWVIFGGEALEPASLAPWFARHGDERPRLINMYGITETTVHVTWRPVRAADLAAGSLIGQPIPDLAVHLLDASLQPVPVGTPGEIHVGGAGLAQGYLGRPDLTAERFVPNPFSTAPGARLYRSGDLARRLPDGDLEYLGRIDQQVKIRGFRIELGEIETALAAQPGVREAVVLAREDGHGGERRLVAYMVGEAADPAALRRSLAERLPDYMLPTAFVFLDALPLTENGKIDRPALPAPEADAVSGKDRVAPRTPLERFLAAQFRDVLGLPAGREIGTGEDFFELGGTSISSAIFTHRLQEALGEIVHIVTIFDNPTVSSLADYVRERHAEAARRLEEGGVAAEPVALERGVLVPIQTGSPERRPFFLIHSVGGEVMAYLQLARLLGPDQPVYGLQSPDPPLEDVREMAALYAATLREVQPQGPYRIAGWSMGGIVAFELARQLEAQGEKTEVLAVIDTTAPGRWNDEPEFRSAEWMALFATALEQIYAVEIPPGVELPDVDMDTLDMEAALGIALDLGRKVGLLSPTLEPAELRRIFERFRANRSSLRTYHGPYSYGGELHLFRATDGSTALAEDPTLGWGELLNGRVRIFDIPGDHRTIVKRGAEAMAAQLRVLLGEGD